jgi:hypothetical protein
VSDRRTAAAVSTRRTAAAVSTRRAAAVVSDRRTAAAVSTRRAAAAVSDRRTAAAVSTRRAAAAVSARRAAAAVSCVVGPQRLRQTPQSQSKCQMSCGHCSLHFSDACRTRSPTGSSASPVPEPARSRLPVMSIVSGARRGRAVCSVPFDGHAATRYAREKPREPGSTHHTVGHVNRKIRLLVSCGEPSGGL